MKTNNVFKIKYISKMKTNHLSTEVQLTSIMLPTLTTYNIKLNTGSCDHLHSQ